MDTKASLDDIDWIVSDSYYTSYNSNKHIYILDSES